MPLFALFAQKESRNVNAGNKHYVKEKFVESEVEYRKGLEQNNSSFSANFNLGNALYRQEKYEDAANLLTEVKTTQYFAEDMILKAPSKNIMNKLKIHSPAGLTIYAIVNKLVQLEDLDIK